eukprot:7539454-Pyramimonas_sp.AAC.1
MPLVFFTFSRVLRLAGVCTRPILPLQKEIGPDPDRSRAVSVFTHGTNLRNYPVVNGLMKGLMAVWSPTGRSGERGGVSGVGHGGLRRAR